MNQLVSLRRTHFPYSCSSSGRARADAFWEIFLSNIRNPQTRRAYACTLYEFFVGADPRGELHLDIRAIQPCR